MSKIPTKVIPSTCEECSTRCGSLIHVEGDKVTKITGNPAHPHSKGAFCVKGMNAPITSREHPDRLLYPLKRMGERGEGNWARISWEQAFGEIAARLKSVKGRYGAQAIAGAVSSQLVNRGVAMALLLRSLGTPNILINQDMCQGGRLTAGHLTGLGGPAGTEIESSRCLLVVGKSPSDSNVVQWMQLKAAKRRGARVIVVDPRRTQMAQQADLWLQIKPGTDAALALAMVNVIFAEDLLDREFCENWCVGIDKLRARAGRFDLASAARITGVPADHIVQAARAFASEKPGAMILGHGIDAQANGVGTAMAFHSLLALTGNVARPGTNRQPARMPGFRDYVGIVNDPAFRLPPEAERKIIGGDEYPFWSGPDSWAKSSHNASLIKAIATGAPYPVRALYVSGVNIVCTYPGMQETIGALRSLDTLVVATDHMTPTAELADFVLPKTNLLEEEAVLFDAGGPCLSVIQQALPPKEEVKSDFEIAFGLRDAARLIGLIEHELLPWNSSREFIDFQLRNTGTRFEDLSIHGFQRVPAAYEAYRESGFRTPSGKVELYSDRLEAGGYDPLANHCDSSYSRPDAEFDVILMTGIRSMLYHHSRFRNHPWARKQQSAPEIRINPATASAKGIADREWVKVETPKGAAAVYLQAALAEEIPVGLAATGMGWWYPEMAGSDRGALKFNVEAAVPYGPPWDPVSGSAESRNTACKLSKLSEMEISTLLPPAST